MAADATASGTASSASADVPVATSTSGRGGRSGRGGARGPGLFSRIRQFLREVVAELRKVVYPGRHELVTYVVVVVVFVSILTAFVSGLDYGLTKLVLAVFG